MNENYFLYACSMFGSCRTRIYYGTVCGVRGVGSLLVGLIDMTPLDSGLL